MAANPTGAVAILGAESESTDEFKSVTGTFSVSTSTTHGNSAASFRSNPTAGNTGYGEITARDSGGAKIDLESEHVHLGFWYYAPSLPAAGKQFILCQFYSGASTDEGFLRLADDGDLVYEGPGDNAAIAGAISAATWHWIGVRIDYNNDVLELKVDNDSDTSTAVNFSNAINTIYIGHTVGGGTYNTNVDQFFDSIILDGAFHRFADVVRLLPNADGTYDTWVASSGGDAYADVDEVPHDSDTTYVETPSSYAPFTVNLQPASTHSITEDIVSVSPWAVVKHDGLSSGVQLRIRSGSTNRDGTSYTTQSSYKNLQLNYFSDPTDGAAWTTSKLDALEAGIEWVSGFMVGGYTHVTQVMVMVAYIPDQGSQLTTEIHGNAAVLGTTNIAGAS